MNWGKKMQSLSSSSAPRCAQKDSLFCRFSLFDSELLGGAVNGTPTYQREYCAPVCLTVQLLFRRSVFKRCFLVTSLHQQRSDPLAERKLRLKHQKIKSKNWTPAFARMTNDS
jgi:hypothetical protein